MAAIFNVAPFQQNNFLLILAPTFKHMVQNKIKQSKEYSNKDKEMKEIVWL